MIIHTCCDPCHQSHIQSQVKSQVDSDLIFMQLRMAGTSKYCKGKKNSVYSVTENLYYEGQQFNENFNGRITIQKFLLMGFFCHNTYKLH